MKNNNNYADLSINYNTVLIQNKRDFILQQVSLLFDTTPKDILGEPAFGTEFGKYMWELKLSNSALESLIQNALAELDLCGYIANVNIQMYQGSMEDIAIVNINFIDSSTGDKFSETWKLT